MRWYASLRRSGEIAYVRRSGRHAASPSVVAHAAPLQNGPCRIAVTVSKAVGNAVVRNRVKRRIKGALDALGAPEDRLRIVFVARAGSGSEPYERLARDVVTVLGRISRR